MGGSRNGERRKGKHNSKIFLNVYNNSVSTIPFLV